MPAVTPTLGDWQAKGYTVELGSLGFFCITRAEYSRLVHVTARRASRDLQTFIDSGVIRKRGAGRSVVYVKG